MKTICEKEKCTSCGLCVSSCPRNAIKMVENEKGFLYPIIDEDKCTYCNLCKKTCPQNTENKLKQPIKIFACKSKNFEERIESSSGGVFGEICKNIFSKNGNVYGAKFNEKFEVEHGKAKNEIELNGIRRSKYVQSNMKNIYKEIEEDIKQGKSVVFSGTPCQVNALQNYKKIDKEKVFFVDIVCHGVPSPGVFEDYKSYLEKKYNSKIVDINFRYKNENSTQNIKIDFENGEQYISNVGDGDLFYNLFLKNIILRDSCYTCQYKAFERVRRHKLSRFLGLRKRKC